MIFTEKELIKLYALFETYFRTGATCRDIGKAARGLSALLDRAERRVYKEMKGSTGRRPKGMS